MISLYDKIILEQLWRAYYWGAIDHDPKLKKETIQEHFIVYIHEELNIQIDKDSIRFFE